MREEQTLIDKAQEGDRDAFGELYDRYVSKIYRFVFLRVGTRGEAEDITSQVFMHAWENITRYEHKGFPLSSWLYRMASNAVIDHYRTAKHAVDIDSIPEDLFADVSDDGERIDSVRESELLRRAIARLEADQQSVILMKFVNDATNKEISQALGKTEGAVRVIQHRAIKQLKQITDELRSNT